ncbi:MAG: hypothetical protein ACRD68_17070, partial [Pyrinomonadaceae bacterium]
DGTSFPQALTFEVPRRRAPLRLLTAAVLLLIAAAAARAQQQGATACAPADGADALVVGGEYAGDVFGLGRSVVVEGSVRRGVVAFGGDVIVRGRVEGDVASVGGSVRQCAGSYIGGDVIVLGGAYHHGKTAPGRNPASKTLMYAGYEQELRELARNPATLLTPSFSLAYLGQRLLAVLFWFVVSLGLTAISPGAVGRAAARLQLTSLRVAVIGLVGAFVVGPGVLVSLRLLPSALGTLVGIMALVLLTVAYLFGRVVIHAATGRWLQRMLLPEGKRSEAAALLLGAVAWAVMLAVPYVWPLFVAGLVVTSLGLALTARHPLARPRA